jgi:hypothetical protein
MTPSPYEVGVGATAELSLRVSVATLVRVLFKNPNNDELMLALERKATLRRAEDRLQVRVKSQPFGGAIRILDLSALQDVVGDFHFDSERSQAEEDFRIFIRPAFWSSLRVFCLEHIVRDDDPTLETSPSRELAEEFAETLSVNLRLHQYVCKPVTNVVEDRVKLTDNIYALGSRTVRIYRIYEASITDPSLRHLMLDKSEELSNQRLSELAIADAQSGGRGKANGVLALPMERLLDVYLAMLPAERNVPLLYEENRLDPTVAAILGEIAVPRYQCVQ